MLSAMPFQACANVKTQWVPESTSWLTSTPNAVSQSLADLDASLGLTEPALHLALPVSASPQGPAQVAPIVCELEAMMAALRQTEQSRSIPRIEDDAMSESSAISRSSPDNRGEEQSRPPLARLMYHSESITVSSPPLVRAARISKRRRKAK